jgi:hypothetical protein
MNLLKNEIREYKIQQGCALCGYNKSYRALQFAHRDPVTKYRNRNGKPVEPSDMIKGKYRSRYSAATIWKEIDKCDVLCANCHAEQSAEQIEYTLPNVTKTLH